MATVFAFGVENAKDQHPFVIQEIKDFVGKARKQNPPKAAIIKGEAIRIIFQGKHGLADLLEKTISQADLLRFIPLPCFLDILFGTRTDDDNPFHAPRRRRASTSSQGAPTQGFFSKSSISRSSTAFS